MDGRKRQRHGHRALTFDPSPVVTWQIDLDSRGTDLRVDMVFATAKTEPHPGRHAL